MTVISPGFEQKFFRQLNAVVEPAVRHGVGSPRLLPAGLIVLESIGYLSGERRSTPLLSFRAGRYRIVSTVRGDRSFWVRNLVKQPDISYFLGGKRRHAQAIVLQDGATVNDAGPLPRLLEYLVRVLSRFARDGMAIVVLVPAEAPAVEEGE